MVNMLPRSIFRSRRERPPVYLDAVIGAGLAARLKPGSLTEARVWHDRDCPRPRGGACKCRGVDVELVPIGNPERN